MSEKTKYLHLQAEELIEESQTIIEEVIEENYDGYEFYEDFDYEPAILEWKIRAINFVLDNYQNKLDRMTYQKYDSGEISSKEIIAFLSKIINKNIEEKEMTSENTAQLLKFKEETSNLGNKATEKTITTAKKLIKKITTYISTNIPFSDANKKAFENLELIHNYLTIQQFDNNDTTMIVVKENILNSINALTGGQYYMNNTQKATMNKNIFIVHGREDVIKLAVSDFLRTLELEPIILHELPNEGLAIIEKLEKAASKANFAIVLLSPEDCVIEENQQKYRSRQNVILEYGYFCGKYGRQNTFTLYDVSKDKKIELPSDIHGILYEEYDKPFGNWRIALAKGLKAAGYNIDLNKLV